MVTVESTTFPFLISVELDRQARALAQRIYDLFSIHSSHESRRLNPAMKSSLYWRGVLGRRFGCIPRIFNCRNESSHRKTYPAC